MNPQNSTDAMDNKDVLVNESQSQKEPDSFQEDLIKEKDSTEGKKPLEVSFEWAEDGKIAVRVLDESIVYPDSFHKPSSTDTTEFCAEVAKIVEFDLGRPIIWTAPTHHSNAANTSKVDNQTHERPRTNGNANGQSKRLSTKSPSMHGIGANAGRFITDRINLRKTGITKIAAIVVVVLLLFVSISTIPPKKETTYNYKYTSTSEKSNNTSGSFTKKTNNNTNGSFTKKTTNNTTTNKNTGGSSYGSKKTNSYSSTNQVSTFLNSPELNTLKTNIVAAGTDLDKIVKSGDTSQMGIRRALVWSALREFEALSVPSECKAMRNYYVYASENLVYALDYYKDYYTGSRYEGTLANATACIEEADSYLNSAMSEENRLKSL